MAKICGLEAHVDVGVRLTDGVLRISVEVRDLSGTRFRAHGLSMTQLGVALAVAPDGIGRNTSIIVARAMADHDVDVAPEEIDLAMRDLALSLSMLWPTR